MLQKMVILLQGRARNLGYFPGPGAGVDGARGPEGPAVKCLCLRARRGRGRGHRGAAARSRSLNNLRAL